MAKKNDVMLGFVPVDEMPQGRGTRMSTYDQMIDAFLASDDKIICKEFDTPEKARMVTGQVNTRANKTGKADKVKAHSRKNSCYIEKL
jgi:hypothetical protein